MSRDFETALANCLEKLERGDATIEEALRAHPELRAELEPLLGLAAELRSMPKISAPAGLRSSRRPLFVSRGRVAAFNGSGRRMVWALLRPGRAWASPLARLAAGLAATVLLMGGTMVASAGSLPEEPLYPIKLAVESAQMALTSDSQRRTEMEIRFAARRLEEVERSARQGRIEAVQQGLALYEERIESALSRTQAGGSGVPEAEMPLLESLFHQQEVLDRVYTKVPAAAQPAILHAMEVSRKGQVRGDKVRGDSKPKETPGPLSTPEAPAPTSVIPSGGSESTGERESQGKERAFAAPTSTPRGQEAREEWDREQKQQERRDVGAPEGARTWETGRQGDPETRGPGEKQIVQEARPRGTPPPSPSATVSPTAAPTATAAAERTRHEEKGQDAGRDSRPADSPRAGDDVEGDKQKNGGDRGASSRWGSR
ncbi:MAG: DUF5667 domain-containing protein [Chloroflexota bacterium]